ncbi:enoyl-CoA hydratase-related protein [Amycolatopsis pithecellobii]|uniref:Enoyl-CoA hydratase/isomerase family protein n=1 Tax=Amycolatopsis pithecellobii TaxID=664692 RepID=A0A6N7Z544_9PSEU|nr:enoyl-CoA hydratase-related protein [Amycolatopsis pithecellobii]MTD54496.1 hypothetical protein [Amycolatopsis pithecellobii]
MTNIKQSGAVRWSWDSDGIVTITLDDPGRTSNMANARHLAGLDACLDELEARPGELRGVVLTSAKRSFFSGPDVVHAEIPAEEAAGTYDVLERFRDQLRRLETIGRPVAAALVGSALGGGFELALACHYRVGLEQPDVVWALAETQMGIMPGGGGVVRVTRMAGVAATVLDIVGPGTAYRPTAALRAGLIDDVAPTRDAVVTAARDWVLAQREPFGQRWEQPGYRIPGSDIADVREQVRRLTEGTPLLTYPAVLDVSARTAEMPVDEAFPLETQAFLELLSAPVTADMRHNYFDIKAVTAGASRPEGAASDSTAGTTSTAFPRRGELRMADAFFAENAPVIEIHADADADEAAIAAAYDNAVADGGIPIVSRGGAGPFTQALLDASGDVESIAKAARQALADGLVITAADANIASTLAAGFPVWTGGVLRYLDT